jgi:hypothetical protein
MRKIINDNELPLNHMKLKIQTYKVQNQKNELQNEELFVELEHREDRIEGLFSQHYLLHSEYHEIYLSLSRVNFGFYNWLWLH